jgi:hypothetical protein
MMERRVNRVIALGVFSLSWSEIESGSDIIKNFFGEELGEKFLNLIDKEYFSKDDSIKIKFPLFVELTPQEWSFYKRTRLHNGPNGRETDIVFYKQRHFLCFGDLYQIQSYAFGFLSFFNKIIKKKKNIEDADESVIILKKILYEIFKTLPYDFESYRGNLAKKQKDSVKKTVFKVMSIYTLISFAVSIFLRWFYMAPVSMLVFFFSMIGLIIMGIAIMVGTSLTSANQALENMRSEYLEKAGCAFSLSDDVGLSLLRNHIKQRKSFGLVLSPEERELLLEIAEAQCQSEKFDIEMNLTYKPFVLRKIYYGFKKWCMDPNTKGDAFFKINTKWKVEFFKEMLLRGLYERGFTGGIMSISGRLYIRDEGKYEISNDYTLTPEGKMLISMLNRLYE